MERNKTIAFIGAGNMATALIRGLLRTGTTQPRGIVAADTNADQLARLHRDLAIETTLDNREAASRADVVVLSVKPQVMDAALASIAPAVDASKLVISIAAGVPIAAIAARLGPDARVVRAMPNTPALVGAGATAIAAGSRVGESELMFARSIFDAVGITVTVGEALLDAVTGLSGSGPAYAFLIVEALADAGVELGLPRHTAQALAAQTLLGSARMVQETGLHPAELKAQVTSPGGTTIAGLRALEAGGLRATLIDAVERAARRSRELATAAIDEA
ncbi:MAG: pyrroline-5-carboxylate reductase [Myxococcales bacterium]|jgi:pyrroline-5-carboxylate reductase|nr:pyrroline-5-carboxylate reductase [Myxococcales bacterium]